MAKRKVKIKYAWLSRDDDGYYGIHKNPNKEPAINYAGDFCGDYVVCENEWEALFPKLKLKPGYYQKIAFVPIKPGCSIRRVGRAAKAVEAD